MEFQPPEYLRKAQVTTKPDKNESSSQKFPSQAQQKSGQAIHKTSNSFHKLLKVFPPDWKFY